MLTVLSVAALGLLLYAWAGYPLLLGVFGRRRERGAGPNQAGTPSFHLSVVLAAFNEEAVIAARVANLAAAAESLPPTARLWLFLGVDGATDGTSRLAAAAVRDTPAFQLHDFRERRGKVTVLKDLVLAARGIPAASPSDPGERLLVFTDANTFFAPEALNRLLPHFSDPGVGGVCGRLVFTSAPPNGTGSAGAASPESAYWEWETWLKRKESALDSCLGANGAIYAIRERLFWDAIPGNTIVDDFVIAMKVREQGFRMVYEPLAVAEETAPHLASEWTRRVRIGAGDFQALSLCRACLAPRYGRFAWMFWSHKVLRWCTPHLSLIAFTASLVALGLGVSGGGTGTSVAARLATPALRFPLATALAFAGLFAGALVGRMNRHSPERPMRLFRLCDHFVTMQAALFTGFVRWSRGNLSGRWTRTPRP